MAQQSPLIFDLAAKRIVEMDATDTVDPVHLGTGVRDGTKFLRDDGTWQVVSGGGGVSDGDKGDIVVSAGGTVWTIDNSVVTYAKIQNVSATDKLLGRASVGAGPIEEISCTLFGRSLLDDADAAAGRATLGLGAWATVGAGTGPITIAANGVTSVTSQTGTGSTFVMSAGPTFSGVINHSGTDISRTVDTSVLQLSGGTSAAAGAGLLLHGKLSGEGGRFFLHAYDGTTQAALLGKVDGTLQWSVGGGAIASFRVARLISDVAIGTAPLTVTSTTRVTNLNADMLDGFHAQSIPASLTVVARDGDGNISASASYIIDSTIALSRQVNYHTLRNYNGVIVMYLGGTGDPSNYYDNTNHRFRSLNGAATFVTLNDAGLQIAMADYKHITLLPATGSNQSFISRGANGFVIDVNRRTHDGIFTDASATHSGMFMLSGNGVGRIEFRTSNSNNTFAGLVLQIDGSGYIMFSNFFAVVTGLVGYMLVKDYGGNVRKLAVMA